MYDLMTWYIWQGNYLSGLFGPLGTAYMSQGREFIPCGPILILEKQAYILIKGRQGKKESQAYISVNSVLGKPSYQICLVNIDLFKYQWKKKVSLQWNRLLLENVLRLVHGQLVQVLFVVKGN